MASVKLNITLSPELLERTDEYAHRNSLTRSGLIALSLSQYLNAVESMPQVNKLLAGLSAVVDGSLRGDLTKEQAEARLAAIQGEYQKFTDASNK